jgi:hypothetical protein
MPLDDLPPDAAPVPEEEAWGEVLRAWDDEAAHQRYLARFQSLETLSVAGGRYKAVLAEKPGDAMAERMRAEVLRKATAYGLALLPRTPAEASRNARYLRIAVGLLAGIAVVWILAEVVGLLLRGARS